MSIERFELKTNDGLMALSVAAPFESNGAAVIVLHQAMGMSDQVRDTLSGLADAGYLAVAPHLFYRKGADKAPGLDAFASFIDFDVWLGGDAVLVPDLGAVVEWLRRRGFADERIGVVGYSYGGRAAFLAATEWALGAAVTYYGNGIQEESYHGNTDLPALAERGLKTPWLGHFAEEDRFFGPGEIDALTIVAEEQGSRVVRYAGVGHGFDTKAAEPDAPEQLRTAAASAQRDTMNFLAERLLAGSR